MTLTFQKNPGNINILNLLEETSNFLLTEFRIYFFKMETTMTDINLSGVRHKETVGQYEASFYIFGTASFVGEELPDKEALKTAANYAFQGNWLRDHLRRSTYDTIQGVVSVSTQFTGETVDFRSVGAGSEQDKHTWQPKNFKVVIFSSLVIFLILAIICSKFRSSHNDFESLYSENDLKSNEVSSMTCSIQEFFQFQQLRGVSSPGSSTESDSDHSKDLDDISEISFSHLDMC